MRVVSLTCSNTEIVCALGCADALVGVDNHSDFPEDVVSRLPRVGPDLGIDPEAVSALEPDLGGAGWDRDALVYYNKGL